MTVSFTDSEQNVIPQATVGGSKLEQINSKKLHIIFPSFQKDTWVLFEASGTAVLSGGPLIDITSFGRDSAAFLKARSVSVWTQNQDLAASPPWTAVGQSRSDSERSFFPMFCSLRINIYHYSVIDVAEEAWLNLHVLSADGEKEVLEGPRWWWCCRKKPVARGTSKAEARSRFEASSARKYGTSKTSSWHLMLLIV